MSAINTTTQGPHPVAGPTAGPYQHAMHVAAKRRGRVPGRAKTQRGVALVVALLLLIVITLVGFAAVRGTILQQKMSSNMYDQQLAFQSAEAALRAAEHKVQESASPTVFFDCTPTATTACLADPFNDSNVTGSTIKTVPTDTFDAGKLSAAQPQYVVEYMGRFAVPPPNVHQVSSCPSGYSPASCAGQAYYAGFYRITARSGPADVKSRASVTLQSIYKK